MRIALACAGQRGHRILGRLQELVPSAELLVFSFREEPFEPPFLDDIRNRTLSRGGQFIETRKVDGPRALPAWETTEVDLMLVVGWRYMISAGVYRRPLRGTYVFHDSLLPRYRGFSPTVWAVCNGETETGATLFSIVDEVDAGDIVAQQAVAIDPDECIGTVMERVTRAYLFILEKNISHLLNGTAVLRGQDHSAATYVRKRNEADYQIDWTRPSCEIYNLIRAVTVPYSGAFTEADGQRLRVWTAKPLPRIPSDGSRAGLISRCSPGEGAVVLTGSGAVLLKQVQWDGGPRQPAEIALRDLTCPLGQ